tara:strand:+ start:2246 stop:3244 length:999 start_codon:yes stop_codon:yes gene_type:complete
MKNLKKDPKALKESLNDLGWRASDSKDYDAQRDYLIEHNGIRGLQILEPDKVKEAKKLFDRDGFVVIKNALTENQLKKLRKGCDEVIREILSLDKNRIGNRGSHRYSFGSSSITGHLMHRPEWAMLLDLPTVTPILSAIFDSPEYIARGGGGDFCLPGATEYQHLHSDMGDKRTFGSFYDDRGKLTVRDLPCPYVCCNFLMIDFNQINGPIRQIAGTQNSLKKIPRLTEEPEWMKLSTVCPAPAGSVLIRDVRAWHGGTPNLSNEVRAIPNAEFFAPWYREPMPISMPWEIYNNLTDHGKSLARYIVCDSSETIETGYRLENTQVTSFYRNN